MSDYSLFIIIILILMIFAPGALERAFMGGFIAIAAIPCMILIIFIVYEASQGSPNAIILLSIPIILVLIRPLLIDRNRPKTKKEREEEAYLQQLVEARKAQLKPRKRINMKLSDYWP